MKNLPREDKQVSRKVISGGNVATKRSDKKMEGEDALKTLECLRGRLLAERGASRVANEEAKQMGNKLIELENQLRKEVKSRNRAEKRLKSLTRKLESMNISYVFVVSDESSSEQSSSFEKSEFSSVSSSSTASSSSYPKSPKDDNEQPINTQIRNSIRCEIEEPVKEKEFPSSEILKHNLTNTIRESHIVPSSGKSESDQPLSEKSNDSHCTQNVNDPVRDDHRSKSSVEDKEIKGKNYQDRDEGCVDNSMALVPVDIPVTAQTTSINPAAIDNASVKDVLDILRHVKERLQISMERRHD